MLLNMSILDLQTQRQDLTIAIWSLERKEWAHAFTNTAFYKSYFFLPLVCIFVSWEPNCSSVSRGILIYTMLTSFSSSIELDIRFVLQVFALVVLKTVLILLGLISILTSSAQFLKSFRSLFRDVTIFFAFLLVHCSAISSTYIQSSVSFLKLSFNPTV